MSKQFVSGKKEKFNSSDLSALITPSQGELIALNWFLRRSTVYWNLLFGEVANINRRFGIGDHNGNCSSESEYMEHFYQKVMALDTRIEATEARVEPGDSQVHVKQSMVFAKEFGKTLRTARAMDMYHSVCKYRRLCEAVERGEKKKVLFVMPNRKNLCSRHSVQFPAGTFTIANSSIVINGENGFNLRVPMLSGEGDTLVSRFKAIYGEAPMMVSVTKFLPQTFDRSTKQIPNEEEFHYAVSLRCDK